MKKKDTDIGLSHKEFLSLDKDYSRTAAAVDLVYVKDNLPGISRKAADKTFTYFHKNKIVADKKNLDRIKKLAIPPAWTHVWVCPNANGHVQATGIDDRDRKQYRYHTLWNKVRSETKFHRLYAFGNALPLLRKQLEKDLSIPHLSEQKVLATVILLMERTYIRVGNYGYEKMNGTYGLTTLKDKHIKIDSGEMNFAFKGKKGVHHNISLQNKRLARIVKECSDIPGEELFQYYQPDGSRKSIDSGSVNQYIKEASGMDFSAKDFRLWAGSLNILLAFNSMGRAMTKAATKQNILTALDQVSAKLGNTRTVCRKYYVHPGLIQLYEEDSLEKYLKELNAVEKAGSRKQFTHEEKVLMKILKGFH